MNLDNPDPSPAPAPHTESWTATRGTAGSPLLLKLDAVAAELQCTRRTLERQIAAGRITALHIGRSVRIERRELDAFVDLLRDEAHSQTHRDTSAARVFSWADPQPHRGGDHGQTA